MPEPVIRPVNENDIPALWQLEQDCFQSDRLSRRRFRHWVSASHRVFLVAEQDQKILGYCLVILHRGTRLARLYSLALSRDARGTGLGRELLVAAENGAARRGRLFMRLEVATDNYPAIRLYEKSGYVVFATAPDYYEDHRDALRMQKRIRYQPVNLQHQATPWYGQTTEFTCGPAAAMMAMAALRPGLALDQSLELTLWREATTIYMTSGHGGTHPVGLALAMQSRGFQCEVYLNQSGPLFLNGVRSAKKRDVMTVVDQDFRQQAQRREIPVHLMDIAQNNIAQLLEEGAVVIVLISTYRLDGKKAPHWVTVTGIDDDCLYVHDPYLLDDGKQPMQEKLPIDCQYLPIAREDFHKMSEFGKERLRTAIVVRNIGNLPD